MKGLDGFLERDRDRELFDLPPNKENVKSTPGTAAAPSVPASKPLLGATLPGWRPHRLDDGDWGSLYPGDTSALPPELVGANITVQLRDGQSWTRVASRSSSPGPGVHRHL